MSKLDEFTGKSFRECAEIIVGNPKDKDWTDMQINALCKQHEQLTKEKFLGLIGEPEQRETTDMSLASWTPEDYKAFGKNELKIELRQKVEEL